MVHADLENAADTLGLELDTLRRTAEQSMETIDQARAWLADKMPLDRGKPLDVVVHGSYARLEASTESDFDYLVIAHELASDVGVMREMLAAVDAFIEEKFGDQGPQADKHRPGRTGLFGRIDSAPGLTERIGLEQDTNASTTRRLLILEESVSIYQPELRERLVAVILERYLADYDGGKAGVPRFLLNDVNRYWYTLAVDYQAKRWQGVDRNWGLRYLKLLISRKLAYTGSLVSLLLCDDEERATVQHLARQFDKPPLARLAQLVDRPEFDKHEELAEALQVADQFTAFLGDSELRERAENIESVNAMLEDPQLREIREAADRLHSALGRILFDSYLGDRARRYLVL